MVGWDHGCRLAAEKKVLYRTEKGEEKQASVDACIAAGVPGREEIKLYQLMEVG